MPTAVRFHPAAALEAEEAYTWYADRSPDVAHSFREELRHAVDAVAGSPGTWPRHGRHARRYVFPRFSFSLVYILRGDEVEVGVSREETAWLLAVAALTADEHPNPAVGRAGTVVPDVFADVRTRMLDAFLSPVLDDRRARGGR